MEEKMMIDFIEHYDIHRKSYENWKVEDVAKTFISNWKLANATISSVYSREECVFVYCSSPEICKKDNKCCNI